MKYFHKDRVIIVKCIIILFCFIFALMACSYGKINKRSSAVGLYSYKSRSIGALVRTGNAVCTGSTIGQFVGAKFHIKWDNKPVYYYIDGGEIDKAFLYVLSKYFDSVEIIEKQEKCNHDYCFSISITEFQMWKADTSLFYMTGSLDGIVEVTRKGGGVIEKINFNLSNPKKYSGKGCGVGSVGSIPLMNLEGAYDYAKDAKYIINNLLAEYEIPESTFRNLSSRSFFDIINERTMMETNRVLWEYDLESSGTEVVVVELSVTVSGKTYLSKDLHLEGDVGKVTPGKGKKIWWNVLRDFPRGLDAKVDWELSTEVAR